MANPGQTKEISAVAVPETSLGLAGLKRKSLIIIIIIIKRIFLSWMKKILQSRNFCRKTFYSVFISIVFNVALIIPKKFSPNCI